MDSDVVGFKSIICYRSGMNVSLTGRTEEKEVALENIRDAFDKSGKVRLAHKALNDEVVRIGLEIAGHYGKPGMLLRKDFGRTSKSRDSAVSYRIGRQRHHIIAFLTSPPSANHQGIPKHGDRAIAFIVPVHERSGVFDVSI